MKHIVAMLPLELQSLCDLECNGRPCIREELEVSHTKPSLPFSLFDSVRQGGSHPHKEKGGGRSSVMKENIGPRLRSNILNMDIPGYFIVGKPNHQEEAGLDVSTVCSLFLL